MHVNIKDTIWPEQRLLHYLTIVSYGSAETEGFHPVSAEQPHLTKF